MTRGRLLLAGFPILLLAAGCGGHLVYTSGPYRGQVMDAETREPLVGAVVLAIWYREVPVAPHGPAEDYHDSLELLTDTKGEFTVPEKTHFTLLGSIQEPHFVVYYPGYASDPAAWVRPRGEEVNVAYERKVFQFELLKLKTYDERVKFSYPYFGISKVPEAKMPNLARLVNEEHRKLGLQPIRLGR